MRDVIFSVNGKEVIVAVDDSDLLIDVLRERLGLTGTHSGCDTAQCGCCTVHLNGRPVKSCTVLAVQANDGRILTIEGLAQDGKLHPLQTAFSQHHALQCGYCTPGMIMSALALGDSAPPDDEAILRAIEGNLCRCTGYVNIVKAIKGWLATDGTSCANKST